MYKIDGFSILRVCVCLVVDVRYIMEFRYVIFRAKSPSESEITEKRARGEGPGEASGAGESPPGVERERGGPA